MPSKVSCLTTWRRECSLKLTPTFVDSNNIDKKDEKHDLNYQESGRGLNANSEDADVGLDLFSVDDNVSQISGLVADELTRTPV